MNASQDEGKKKKEKMRTAPDVCRRGSLLGI